MPLTFALATVSKLITRAELYELSAPLEANARHCAKAWGKEPPAIVVVDKPEEMPRGCCPVIFLDDTTEDAGALAVHYVDPARFLPAARVYCDRSSGLRHGRYSICEAAAHEVTEALCDPYVNLWADMPGRDGVQVAIEVADPVQTHYTIHYAGHDWPVANFVTPAWFDSRLWDTAARAAFLDGGGRFDHSGELHSPGQIGPEGYAVLRQRDDSGWRTWSEARPMEHHPVAHAAVRAEAVKHPWARTRRRGA